MEEFERLRPDERELIGEWIRVDDQIDGDYTCKRIQFLTEEYLKELGKDWSGWETLFRDPTDGRYWERTYPHSDWHGGGPPALFNLSEEEAREKYTKLFNCV